MIISPASLLTNNFNPRDTLCMPVVKIVCRLKSDKIIYPVTVSTKGLCNDSP